MTCHPNNYIISVFHFNPPFLLDSSRSTDGSEVLFPDDETERPTYP